MLEWFVSKVGVIIAVGVITAFVLGLFAWQHQGLVERELQAVADNIAGAIQSLDGLDAATELNISFGSAADELPYEVDSRSYTINITPEMVIIRQGNRIVTSGMLGDVIPENLPGRNFNTTEYEALEPDTFTGEHESGNVFTIERARIEVSGETRYVTLVYW